MSSRTLNPRQERFCQGIVEGLAQSRAYIEAGYTARGNAAEVEASKMVRKPKVAARVAELRARAASRSETTVDTLVAELDEILLMAKEIENASAGVSAVMAKARLLGLIIDRSEVSTTVRKPMRQPTDRQQMSMEEWTARFAPKATH